MEKIQIISFGKNIGKIKKVFGRKKQIKVLEKNLQKKVLGKNYKKMQIKVLEKNLQKKMQIVCKKKLPPETLFLFTCKTGVGS